MTDPIGRVLSARSYVTGSALCPFVTQTISYGNPPRFFFSQCGQVHA